MAVSREKRYYEFIIEGVNNTFIFVCSLLHSPNQDFQDFYVSSGAPETVQARKAIFRVRSWDIPE